MSDYSGDYVIWSHEHGQWWRSGGWGYTPRLFDAGRYTWEQAVAICAKAVRGTGTELGALPELPIRFADAQAVVILYDAQYPDHPPEPWD